MSTVNMDFRFEGSNLILKLAADEPNTAAVLAAFQKLDFGRGSRFHKFVENGHTRTPLKEYMEKWERENASPEAKRLTVLENRVNPLEARVEVLHSTLEELKKRLEQVGAPVKRGPRVKRDPATYLPTVLAFVERVEAGEPLAVKLNAIVKASGLAIFDVRRKNRRFNEVDKNEIRAVGAVEHLHKKYGDESLRTIMTLMAQLLEVASHVHYTHLEALAYALYDAPKPLHPDAVFTAAVDIFSVEWRELTFKINELKAETGLNRGPILGRLITGELKL